MSDVLAMPRRVQLSRKKGWKMPPNTVKVDRTTMWGNWAAWREGLTKQPDAAVAEFRRWVEEEASDAWKGRAAIDLRGKNLACWCPLNAPCHADVLLVMANVEWRGDEQASPAKRPSRTQG